MSGGAAPYRTGAAFEHRIRRVLEAGGWDTSRSAGSHDDADIIAIGPTPKQKYGRPHRHAPKLTARTVFFQCRLNGRTSPAERDEWIHRWKDRVEFYVVRRHGPRGPLEVRDLFNWLQGWEPFENAL